MIIDKAIPIRNIYYMLSYAFKELRHNNYEQIAGEDFENIFDLFAEILYKGVSYLLKQGLHKEYILNYDVIPQLRGKLHLQGTITEKFSQRKRLACEYDEFTINNVFNQIIKSTVILLTNQNDVKNERKQALRKLMLYFAEVDEIRPSWIQWNHLRYDRNSRTYQMLHSLCYFVMHNQLITNEDGTVQMAKFSDEHMNLLFQRFVLEYYKRHHPDYNPSAKQIKWNFTDINPESSSMLPIMQSDITLKINERMLIIDTKYYSSNTQMHFGKSTILSPNFYQIYTYVMNEDKGHKGNVDGMLLYAQTNSDVQPVGTNTTNDGNVLMVRTLDLSKDFDCIKEALESLLIYKF